MDLYTSLTHLKQELATGTRPPMTSIPAAVQWLIDPAFTIGLGALEEDPERGLRCPVRGCGTYHHGLDNHLAHAHADIGGAAAVRAALEIPPVAPLQSYALRRKRSRMQKEFVAREPAQAAARARPMREARAAASVRAPRARTANLAGTRNLRDRCEAQLRAKLIRLQRKLGHSPTISDVIAAYGHALVDAVKVNYGTWDNGKAQLGFALAGKPGRPLVSREAVLRGIRAFYEAHGEFPTRLEADEPERAPLICSAATTMRALSALTWGAAMHRAAVELGIYRGEANAPRKVRA